MRIDISLWMTPEEVKQILQEHCMLHLNDPSLPGRFETFVHADGGAACHFVPDEPAAAPVPDPDVAAAVAFTNEFVSGLTPAPETTETPVPAGERTVSDDDYPF